MKKAFLSLALVAAAMTACQKETSVEPVQQSEKVRITIGIEDDAETKITGITGGDTDETKVANLQVFIFNGDVIDGYGLVENTKEITLDCTAGTRDIYTVVNGPDLRTITNPTDLMKCTSNLLNRIDKFEMVGVEEDVEITTSTTIPVKVTRFASRIKVKKVTNALTSPALQNQTFKLMNMYITNVAADIDYKATDGYVATKWYNMMGFQSTNNCGNITKDTINQPIDYSNNYSKEHVFYAYPNEEAYSADLEWSPRATMLVLQVLIGTKTYDYPILLPVLERNKSYEIDNITITRPGNLDDGEPGGLDEMVPVEGLSCKFTVTVNPWTVVTVDEGTTI